MKVAASSKERNKKRIITHLCPRKNHTPQHMCRQNNSLPMLYSNDNYDVAQRVDIANKMSVYLREIFEGIEPSTLADFINGLDDEVLHEMCGFYDVSRRNFQNTNYMA